MSKFVMMTESELLQHATMLIDNYFGEEIADVLKMDWEQAHAEVAKWMSTERPDAMVPGTWEMQIAFERIVEAEKGFRS